MLTRLPNELLDAVLGKLEYDDLDTLSTLECIRPIVQHHLYQHFRFHCKIASLLRLFEALCPVERRDHEIRSGLAMQLLQFICHIVENHEQQNRQTTFTDLLDTLQKLVIRRILSPDLQMGLEQDYASLCLEVRRTYMHTPSIRVLHDYKYRRRSTKYPLAPFLPRDYAWLWRAQCAKVSELLKTNDCRTWASAREGHVRFAHFFGCLFEVTSLYLESNISGTFEECVGEALVSGNVESLLVLCVAAEKPVDVDDMCMMVAQAREEFWSYLDIMDDLFPHTTATVNIEEEILTGGALLVPSEPGAAVAQPQPPPPPPPPEPLEPPPDWMVADRYKVTADARLRLKLMNGLFNKGWHWFH
ncbi:hypothetical protein CLU79DRAFT_163981 [Phycomyces nitens]|nr:hypothetical protein CLU79DRAFT_163981 [Phycomyces nitens]